MKRIRFEVTYDTPNGGYVQAYNFNARSIESGFRKATDYAIRTCPKGWTLCKVEFSQVLS